MLFPRLPVVGKISCHIERNFMKKLDGGEPRPTNNHIHAHGIDAYSVTAEPSNKTTTLNHLTATSWNTWNHTAECCPNSWFSESRIINVCCFKLCKRGGNLLTSNSWLMNEAAQTIAYSDKLYKAVSSDLIWEHNKLIIQEDKSVTSRSSIERVTWKGSWGCMGRQ